MNELWYFFNTSELVGEMPFGPVWQALNIIMRHNVFQFGDTYWLQLTGTAMGTPPAPAYATIYFAIHEMRCILDRFGKYLLFYKRYLDDVFGIWYCPDAKTDKQEWAAFQHAMNSFGKLRWEFSERNTTVTFLDVTITIGTNRRIVTSLFEKS